MQTYLLFCMSVKLQQQQQRNIFIAYNGKSEQAGWRHIVLTSYGLGSRGIVVAFLAGSERFPLLVKSFDSGSGAQPASCSRLTCGLSPGVKAVEA
jgi:cytochrome bd-type quinol oxidase subunit 2